LASTRWKIRRSCGDTTLTEPFITKFDELAAWLQLRSPRDDDPAAVECLERVNERRAVMLVENVLADFQHVVRPEPRK